jgi:hypothetical protein
MCFRDRIWFLRTQKLKLKSRLKELRTRSRQHLLQLCFQQWKGDLQDNVQAADFQRYRTTLLCGNVHVYAQLRFCANKLKRELSYARLHYLKAKIAELPQDIPAGQILKVVKQVAGPPTPKSRSRRFFQLYVTKMALSLRLRSKLQTGGFNFSVTWKGL